MNLSHYEIIDNTIAEMERLRAKLEEMQRKLARPDYEFWRQERARVLALNEIHPEIGNYLAAIDTILELEDDHARAKDRGDPAGDCAAPERLSAPHPNGADVTGKGYTGN